MTSFNDLATETGEEVIKWINRKRDLRSLALTCKGLKQLVTPKLYNTIEIHADRWTCMAFHNIMNSKNYGLRYTAFVIERLPCHSLESIKFVGFSEVAEKPSEYMETLLEKQQRLVEIDIRYLPRLGERLQGIIQTQPSIRNLTKVAITLKSCRSWNNWKSTRAFLERAINIQHIEMYGGALAAETLDCILAHQSGLQDELPKLQLRSFKIYDLEVSRWMANRVSATFDFSKLESLTLQHCSGAEHMLCVVSEKQCQEAYLRDVSIKHGDMRTDLFMQTLQDLTGLERLVLYHVRHSQQGHRPLAYVDTVDVLRDLCTSVVGVACKLRVLFFHSSFWKEDDEYRSLGYGMIELLLQGCPNIEELWMDLPSLVYNHARDWARGFDGLLKLLASAPRLRILVNTTKYPFLNMKCPTDLKYSSGPSIFSAEFDRQQDESAPILVGERAYGDIWTAHTVNEIFRTTKTTNPALEIYGHAFMHADAAVLNRTRFFLRCPRLLASGQIETVVEEIDSMDLKYEKPAFDWSFMDATFP